MHVRSRTTLPRRLMEHLRAPLAGVPAIVPALRASRPDLVEVLKENTASVLSGGRRRFALRTRQCGSCPWSTSTAPSFAIN